MRAALPTVLLALSACLLTGKDPPRIPTPGAVFRYERERPDFNSNAIRRERGDTLLKLLAGGEALREPEIPEVKREAQRQLYRTNGIIACVFPSSEYLTLSIILTNGTKYRLGVSRDGRTLWLPDGLWWPSAQLAYRIQVALDELVSDLKDEILAAPRPLLYTVGTLDDGGTLSGMARLFYRDASKWRQIHEANRRTLKNPDVVNDGVRLTIPALK